MKQTSWRNQGKGEEVSTFSIIFSSALAGRRCWFTSSMFSHYKYLYA